MIRLSQVTFSYPGREDPALKEVSLQIPKGQAVLLTGPTGCGKSTFLKLLNGIIPQESSGRLEGEARIAGTSTKECTIAALARQVGLVFQNPDDQLFCGRVREEIAFGPENLGLASADIQERMDQALAMTGLSHLIDHHSARLSGGQKQRVAIASQLAMLPEILALDEPVSQLDPKGTAEVVDCLVRLKTQGLTLIVVEHRISEVFPLVDRIIVMDHGKVVLDIPREDLSLHIDVFVRLGLEIPGETTPWLQGTPSSSFGVPAGSVQAGPQAGPALRSPETEPVLTLDQVGYLYPGTKTPALWDVNLNIYPGEILAVIGHNGSGKTTLLSLMAGLAKPKNGRIRLKGRPLPRGRAKSDAERIGFLFQNPDLLLIESTVDMELGSGPRYLKKPLEEIRARVTEIAQGLGLSDYLDVPPWALSKGQRLRVALGAILAMNPRILLMDEPTTGQNRSNVFQLIDLVRKSKHVEALAFCSHDLEAVSRFATRVLVLGQGRILAQGRPEEILGDPGLLSRSNLCRPATPEEEKALQAGSWAGGLKTADLGGAL